MPTILFHTADGTLLSGDFWVQPQPAPTIIICHGYRINRAVLRPVAALEYKHGHNVLLFDFRGHGESESVATSGGNAKIRDLEAALVVARQQAETIPGKIVIDGFSMGASVALLVEPQLDVAAIIADSPDARLDQMGPVAVKSYPRKQLVKPEARETIPAGRARQEIDYGWREKVGYVFGALQPRTGAVYTATYTRRRLVNWIDFLQLGRRADPQRPGASLRCLR